MKILPGGKRSSIWADYVPFIEIRNENKRRAILGAVRRWLDSIENYAQYAVRRLQYAGIVVNLSTSITPVADGYVMTIHISVQGVHEKLVQERWSHIKNMARDMTPLGSAFRKMEKEALRKQDSQGVSQENVGDGSDNNAEEDIEPVIVEG